MSRRADGLRSTAEAAEAAGVTYRQVDFWVRRDVVAPAVAARGSGSVRLFDEHNVAVLRLLGRLSDLGAERRVLAAAVAAVRALPLDLDRWEGLLFVAEPGGRSASGWGHALAAPVSVRVIADHGTVTAQAAWVVNLGSCAG